MTATPTHWMEYGESAGDGRVKATKRTTYRTGPNEPAREDDVTLGTLTFDGLDAGWEDNSEHVHEDNALLLSALPDDERERVEQAFEPARATAEVLESNYDETCEWEFEARVRVRLHNPKGDDVVVHRTYQARPKHDDLTSDPEKVHETATYWWPDDYSSEGDTPFHQTSINWRPGSALDDDEALLAECVEDNATYDPEAELDGLKASARIPDREQKRLTRGDGASDDAE